MYLEYTEELYDNFKEYCLSKGITAKQLRLDVNTGLLVKGGSYDRLNNSKLIHFFNLNHGHYNSNRYSDLFYGFGDFESSIEHLITQVDSVFNNKQIICYEFFEGFYFDKNDGIKKIKFFEFDDYGWGGTIVFDDNNKSISSWEPLIINYYNKAFCGNKLPEEFKKPFLELTDIEKNLITMLCI